MSDAPISSGTTWCRRALETLVASAAVAPSCVVFDLDNTLFDTRLRTLHAAHTFEGVGADHPLRRLVLDQVCWDGRLTAGAAGLDPALVEAFHQHWDRVFWDPLHFALDAPIEVTCRWLHAATAAGADVFYLTGRVEALAEATLTQLHAAGLPLPSPEHLLSKPSMAERTSAFKQRSLELLSRAHDGRVLWSMGDTAADALTAIAVGVPAVIVDFPVRPTWDARHDETLASTPRLSAFTPARRP